MNTIINPTNNKTYSIFSKQGKQLLKNYIKQFKGGMNEENTKMNQEDKDRMYTFLLSGQRKRQQNIEQNKYNSMSNINQEKNIKKHITGFVNNPFNYTNEQLQYIQDNKLDIKKADKNGNINCTGDMDGSYNCFNCRNCKNCKNCIRCEDCENCYACNFCVYYCEWCFNCFMCKNCKDCENCQDCNNCSENCANCKKCTVCRNCKNCQDCFRCKNCTKCHHCQDCQNCVSCQNVIDCKDSYGCNDCKNIPKKDPK